MTGRNPYEKQEELDIPDFVEDKTNSDSSIDMSIFKMSDEELYDDVTDDNLQYEDDFDDLKPKKKKKQMKKLMKKLLKKIQGHCMKQQLN